MISSARISWPVFMIDVKVSKEKHISRWVDRNIFVMLDEIASKTVHQDDKNY